MDGFYKDEFPIDVTKEEWKTVFAACDTEVGRMSKAVEEEVRQLCDDTNKEDGALESLVGEENQVLMNVIIERKCPQNVHPYSAHYVDSPFARRMAGLNTPTAQVQTAEQARLDIMALVNNRLHQTGKKLVVEKRVDFDSKRDVIMNGFLVRELIPQTNRRSKQGSTVPDLNSKATSSSIAPRAVSGELPQVTPNARLTSTGKRKAGRYVAPFHELVQAAEKIKGTSNGKRVAKNLFLEDETTQVPLTKAPDGVEGTDASSANAQSSAENGEIGGEAIPESIEPNVHLTIARETERSTKVNTVELSLDGMEAGAEHSCYM